ncbi:hypothetical protein HPB51_028349 [Rhipicephalus microplus]|uniref:HTH psq-type domain-containing protein n=1 Tax=Rhipicephalus microplus TaxID=6941 RepID=A0A9J6CXK4_RHIMP|nr:hypothetical protein HPB51_028349 [Rhipicephalus microplus]
MSRNRKPLTLGEKLRVIEEAEKRTGSTKASIARDLNIPESSLKTILAKKDSILLNASKFGLNRKAAKDGKYAAMEKALLPGSFADYVGADDDVAVCSAVSLDDIIETVRPDSAETSDEEEMDDTAEASASVPTYTDVLDYVDNIRRFACAYDEVGDLLQDVAALERKLMRRGWANSQKKLQIFLRGCDSSA